MSVGELVAGVAEQIVVVIRHRGDRRVGHVGVDIGRTGIAVAANAPVPGVILLTPKLNGTGWAFGPTNWMPLSALAAAARAKSRTGRQCCALQRSLPRCRPYSPGRRAGGDQAAIGEGGAVGTAGGMAQRVGGAAIDQGAGIERPVDRGRTSGGSSCTSCPGSWCNWPRTRYGHGRRGSRCRWTTSTL